MLAIIVSCVIGLFIGVTVGIFIAALCFAARDTQRQVEEMQSNDEDAIEFDYACSCGHLQAEHDQRGCAYCSCGLNWKNGQLVW